MHRNTCPYERQSGWKLNDPACHDHGNGRNGTANLFMLPSKNGDMSRSRTAGPVGILPGCCWTWRRSTFPTGKRCLGGKSQWGGSDDRLAVSGWSRSIHQINNGELLVIPNKWSKSMKTLEFLWWRLLNTVITKTIKPIQRVNIMIDKIPFPDSIKKNQKLANCC